MGKVMTEPEELIEEARQRKEERDATVVYWKRWFKIFFLVLAIIIPIQLGGLIIWKALY